MGGGWEVAYTVRFTPLNGWWRWAAVATIRTTHDVGGVPDKKEICMLRKVDGFSLLEQPRGSVLSCDGKKDSSFVVFKIF